MRRLVLLCAACVLLMAGCSSDAHSCSQAAEAASCALGVQYDDHYYVEWVDTPAPRGEALDGVVIPPCNDTGCDSMGGLVRAVHAWELRGIDPDEALIVRFPRRRLTVFLRHDVDPRDYFRRSANGEWKLRQPSS